mgnify:FL=1
MNNSIIIFSGAAIIGVISSSLYLWTWVDRSWFDVILIPEYISILESVLYLGTALCYGKQDTLGGYYTLAIHKIELTASILDLIASILW